MKLVGVLLLALIVVGCGDGSSEAKSKRMARKPKRVLSETEKKKYITPTIYYVADYSSQPLQCAEMVDMNIRKSKKEIAKVSVCKSVHKGCALQGSCYIQFEGQKTLINYHKKVNGVIQFMTVDPSVCRHGMGDSSDTKQSFKLMCLDPFYSVAADTAIYPLGTVIFVRAVVGARLPDGTTHDGYFVVRDSGGNIDGFGRFDFFTGDLGLNASNPFLNLGLGGESNFDYVVVQAAEAAQVRERRNFPLLKN